MIDRGSYDYLMPLILCLVVSTGVLSCASTGGPTAASARGPTPTAASPTAAPAAVWRLSEVSVAYPDGIVSSVIKFSYDADGRLAKEEEFTGSMVPVGRKDYGYGSDGVVLVTQIGDSGETLGKTRREFLAARLVGETLLNARDEVQSKVTFTYDAKGRQRTKTVMSASGNQVVAEYEWVKDLLSGISIYDAGKNPLRKYSRHYGKSGLLEFEDEIGPDGEILGKTAYSYNGSALAREERQNGSGAAVCGMRYEYDANGNVSLIEAQDRLGKPIEIRRQTWVAFEGQ